MRAVSPILLLLVVCGLIVAFLGSGSAFRSDEVWTLHAIQQPPGGMIETVRHDIHPPFYFILLWIWARIAGYSEVGLRALSGILYLATIWIGYRAGKSLFQEKEAAWLAAAILATSPLSLMGSQFARMYALLALLSLVSGWAFLELQRSEWRDRRWIAVWILASAAGTLTHYWFLFLAAAEGILGLASAVRRRDWSGLRLTLLAGAIAALPFAVLWLPTLLAIQIPQAHELTAWVPPPDLGEAGRVGLMYFGWLALFLPVYGYAFWKRTAPRPLWNALAAVLLALAIPLVISTFKPIFYTRFTIIGLPLFALFAAGALPGRVAKQLAHLLLILTTAGSIRAALNANPCDSRRGALHLAAKARPGDVAVFSSLSRMPLDHYFGSIEDRPRVEEVSFPKEIDRHPGYEGRLDTAERVAELERQASEIVDQVRRQPGRRIFYFYGFHGPVDSILKRKLDAALIPLPNDSLDCEDAGASYFSHIGVYQAR